MKSPKVLAGFAWLSRPSSGNRSDNSWSEPGEIVETKATAAVPPVRLREYALAWVVRLAAGVVAAFLLSRPRPAGSDWAYAGCLHHARGHRRLRAGRGRRDRAGHRRPGRRRLGSGGAGAFLRGRARAGVPRAGPARRGLAARHRCG